MRLLVHKIIFFLTFALPATGNAATITNSELPGTIQSCITMATCFVSNTSSYDSSTVSAYQIFQSTGAGYEGNWLIRYKLSSPSGQSHINPSLSDSFSGYLWMLAKNNYSATETLHPFTLYLDKVSPTPFNMFNQSGDISLSMTTTDLIAGNGYRTWGLDWNNNSYSYGDLSGEVPLPCVAQTCETHAQLNLIQLMYGNFGSSGIFFTSFNPGDTRGLVFTQYSYYSGLDYPLGAIDDRQSFYISAVPLPGAMWLFSFGLAGLIGVMRHSYYRK